MNGGFRQRADYTFKYNRGMGRHGWLRLTPAYSVKLVEELIGGAAKGSLILDPFSGTATTGLVAAERGLTAHCIDINPFLIWLGNAKCRNYAPHEIDRLKAAADAALAEAEGLVHEENWLPEMHNITRWWCASTLRGLAAIRQSLVNQFGEPGDDASAALAWVAFCRLIIETSAAAFNHVSVSFHDETTTYGIEQAKALYLDILEAVTESARHPIPGSTSVHFADSRQALSFDGAKYSHVVTSPPYPNRISYIRELRPYMYWTKFLNAACEAGELDWDAIGGTWGIATSRLQSWESTGLDLPESVGRAASSILATGEKNALLMANYVRKYFHDMHSHLQNLRASLDGGAVISLIVGNSTFYGIQVHTDKLLEDSLRALGFANIGSKVVRKRNCKKELFEYCVHATWQEGAAFVPAFAQAFLPAKSPKKQQLEMPLRG